MFKTIKQDSEAIIIEKKSKFIADAFYVESEEEANKILNEIKKRHYEAKHHCYAYRILNKENIIKRQNDDGEPSGTAGIPIMNILEKRNLTNVLVVVTRYFGGILLGTGGLSRAYSDVTKKVVEGAGEIEKEDGYIVEVTIDYENVEEFEHFCKYNNINIIEKQYNEKVKIKIEIEKTKIDNLLQKNSSKNLQKMEIKIKEEKYISKIKIKGKKLLLNFGKGNIIRKCKIFTNL